MKRRLIAAGVAAMLLAMFAGASPASAATTPRCDEGHWPATVQGKPLSFEPGGAAGYYVWHDSDGWHLRTTTPTDRPHSFTGKIVSSDDIRLVRQFRDEGADRLSLNGNTITFSMVTYNGVDGIDFKVGCTESVSFALKANGRAVPASNIWLGATGTARTNPFRVHRVD